MAGRLLVLARSRWRARTRVELAIGGGPRDHLCGDGVADHDLGHKQQARVELHGLAGILASIRGGRGLVAIGGHPRTYGCAQRGLRCSAGRQPAIKSGDAVLLPTDARSKGDDGRRRFTPKANKRARAQLARRERSTERASGIKDTQSRAVALAGAAVTAGRRSRASSTDRAPAAASHSGHRTARLLLLHGGGGGRGLGAGAQPRRPPPTARPACGAARARQASECLGRRPIGADASAGW